MQIVLAIAVALLVGTGVAAYFYFETFAGLVVAGFALTFRRFAARLVWLCVFVPFMPERWRHELDVLMKDMRRWRTDTWHRLTLEWRVASWPIRAAMLLGYAFAAGFIAGLLILSPGNIRRVPGIGPWLSEVAMPYLMRTATAKSVEARIPGIWKWVPDRMRKFLHWPFMWLWWRTARYGVRTRQMWGKHHRKHRS